MTDVQKNGAGGLLPAYGIFEGGGAKGVAHIGALYVADRQIDFLGVAGASAGAIVAALVAAGYKADELYNPERNPPDGVFTVNFATFFDPSLWNGLKTLRDDYRETVKRSWVVSGNMVLRIWRSWGFYRRHQAILSRIYREYGCLDMRGFGDWFETLLLKKFQERNLKGTGENGRILFRDMPLKPALKIIACDVNTHHVKVFNAQEDGDVSATDAVCASASIPFVFKPKQIQMTEKENALFHAYVDGGLLSNFPTWVFAAESREDVPPPPVFGFSLNNIIKPEQTLQTDNAFLKYVADLASMALEGPQTIIDKLVDDLNTVQIKVNADTLDFEMPLEQKTMLYNNGKGDASFFFLFKYQIFGRR